MDISKNSINKEMMSEARLMKKKVIIFVLCVIIIAGVYLSGCTSNDNTNQVTENPLAVFDTTMGTITMELYMDKTPSTAGNFINLSKSGYYNGTKFHRIAENFMIQGGDPNSKDDNPDDDGQGGPGYTIPDEIRSDLKNLRGTIVMANTGAPNSAGSQFFILVVNASWLDGSFTVFGKVTEGMTVVDAIVNSPNDGRFNPSPGGGRPLTNIVINGITIQDQ
jgi:cyclophilin family peptidyl-prolyl cis-trans isomerase